MNRCLRLTWDGAELMSGFADLFIDHLEEVLTPFDIGTAGSRIAHQPELVELLTVGTGLRGAVEKFTGCPMAPVRAILFDKNPANNWALGWHQDRTICLERRIDTPGYGPWTCKQGLQHVQPPFAIIERMITLRIHLDPVDEGNAPLLVALGSHRLGQIQQGDVENVVSQCERFSCLAKRGDVWAYSTPILHASERNRSGLRRRVLQIDYSGEKLPNGLRWLGI